MMLGRSRLAKPGLERTLDEQQARDRAGVHSLGSALYWHVIRTPQGNHVVVSGFRTDTYGAGYTITATYHDGNEVH